LGHLGTVLGPVGFNQAGTRVLRVNGKALLAPELKNPGVDVFGRLIDNQPTQIAIAYDAYLVAGRQHIACSAGGLLLLNILLVLAEGRGAFGCAIMGAASGLGKVRGNT